MRIPVSSARVTLRAAAVLTALLLPALATAQTAGVVAGRIVDPVGGGIENAIVRLGDGSPVLTTATGAFRIDGVAPGAHTLLVQAFGFVSTSRAVQVNGEETVTVSVTLEIAPFRLDSLIVAPQQVDLDGHVRDPERDVSLPDADILTSQDHLTRTNRRGDFDVDVWEDVPILVRIRAFGYLPLDTVMTPTEDEDRHRFEMEPDLIVERMIEQAIERLEDRAGGRRSVTMRPLNRTGLLRFRGYTLEQVIEFEYRRRRDRIECVVVDERVLTPSMGEGVLSTTLVREVERIEFLFRGAMLRVYTREFMRKMLGSGLELRRPTYVEWANPPLCT